MRSPVAASTVELWVNGERRRLAAANIRALVVVLGLDPTGRGLAVARNGAVVPRGDWETTMLAPDDRIDVVGAVQGG